MPEKIKKCTQLSQIGWLTDGTGCSSQTRCRCGRR